MNKKIDYLFLFLCLGLISFSFASCTSDNDDDKIDEEWKAYQDAEFKKVAADPAFHELKSQANNGSVYWQESTVITDSDLSTSRISPQGTPNFTDTVVLRYEGWFFDLKGKKFVFDSTENPTTVSNTVPNKRPVQFGIDKTPTSTGGTSSIIDGWKTVLQDMTTGEERLVCIPQELGYGASISGYIPAYTTLWFRIKLLEIKSMKGLK